MTFKLPDCANGKIITENAPVRGNGSALGLTDGTSNYGLGKMFINNIGLLQGGTNWYDTQAGTSSSAGTTPANNISLGITTDGTKSGIVADFSQYTTVLMCIKY